MRLSHPPGGSAPAPSIAAASVASSSAGPRPTDHASANATLGREPSSKRVSASKPTTPELWRSMIGWNTGWNAPWSMTAWIRPRRRPLDIRSASVGPRTTPVRSASSASAGSVFVRRSTPSGIAENAASMPTRSPPWRIGTSASAVVPSSEWRARYGCEGGPCTQASTHGPSSARACRWRLRASARGRCGWAVPSAVTNATGMARRSWSKRTIATAAMSDRLTTWRQMASAVSSTARPAGSRASVSAIRARSRAWRLAASSSSRSRVTSCLTAT